MLFFIILSVVFNLVVAAQNTSFHFDHKFIHPYLRNLTDAERKEFFTIGKSGDLKISEIDAKKLEFAEKHGFKDIEEKKLNARAEREKLVSAKLPGILADLSKYHQEYVAIELNKDQTFKQRSLALYELDKKYPSVAGTYKLITIPIARADKPSHNPKPWIGVLPAIYSE